jgi:hypothetical protein
MSESTEDVIRQSLVRCRATYRSSREDRVRPFERKLTETLSRARELIGGGAVKFAQSAKISYRARQSVKR